MAYLPLYPSLIHDSKRVERRIENLDLLHCLGTLAIVCLLRLDLQFQSGLGCLADAELRVGLGSQSRSAVRVIFIRVGTRSAFRSGPISRLNTYISQGFISRLNTHIPDTGIQRPKLGFEVEFVLW